MALNALLNIYSYLYQSDPSYFVTMDWPEIGKETTYCSF